MPKKSNKKSVTTEEAEIECILDERGGGTTSSSSSSSSRRNNKRRKRNPKHEYLCAWTDGEDPQWVDAKYLQNTRALEDWEEAEDEQIEHHDSPIDLQRKCQTLAQWIKAAKRPCFLLGAGISAPVLPTFRGKNGLWTKGKHKNKKASVKVSDNDVQPTKAHRGLVALEKNGFVNFLVTQNYDDLSSKSGFPENKLSELHGNIFTETCEKCNTKYHRNYEVPLETSQNHETGRYCDACGGILRDSIIHFDEPLPWHELKMANAKFVGSDMTIVLGSSLNVEPAASLPFKSKRRTRMGKDKIKSCIVNLQKTPNDDEADLLIRGDCDKVIDAIAKELVGENWDNKENDVNEQRHPLIDLSNL